MGPRTYLALTALGAVALLILRRPESVLRPEFWAEDGIFYTTILTKGLASVVVPNAGYFVVGQRLLTLPELIVPPGLAPLVGNVLAIAVAALVATFVASDRMRPLFPDRWQRLAVAGTLLLLPVAPGGDMMLTSLSNVQWLIAAWLLALTVARVGHRLELVLVAIAGLTGPYGLLLLPLFAARWWRERETWPMLAVIAGTGAIQVVAILLLPQRAMVPPDITLIPMVVLERVLRLSGPAALLGLATIVLATSPLSRRTRLGFGYAIVVLPVTALLKTRMPTWAFFIPGNSDRYFWLGTGLVVAAIIAARPWEARRPRLVTAAWALSGGAAAVLLAGSFAIVSPAATGWAVNSSCIGGPTPCVVPVMPKSQFAVQWPGR